MNGKKALLIVTLVCALSAAVLAQGLVGAPVDPRSGTPEPTPTPPPSGSSTKTSSSPAQSVAQKIVDAVAALLAATRI